MSTSAGRTDFRENGTLGNGFAKGRLTSFPVTAGIMMHEDWNAQNPGLWRETHPWGANYEATGADLDQALADLEAFGLTGEASRGEQVQPQQDRYVVHYRDVTVNLYGVRIRLDSRNILKSNKNSPRTLSSLYHLPSPQNT